jgi:hypothetical protein
MQATILSAMESHLPAAESRSDVRQPEVKEVKEVKEVDE